MTEYSSIYIREIFFILISALVSHTFDDSEFSSHMTCLSALVSYTFELYSPGVILVNYLCHFLLSSFYRGYSCATRLRSCSRDKNLQLEDPTRS